MQMLNNTTSNTSLVWINQYAGGVANKMPITLLGMPIYFSEKCPEVGTAGDVMLLDLTKYLCGDRMQLLIESSPYPNFTTYQMVWRSVWRGDGQPQFDAATTLASGTTTVSPHIILAA
jgi:HK97 family phage major capsid protein